MQIGLGIGTTFRQTWVPSLTEQIRSLLFSASEQGAWYDPSDLSTMFQDAAGTLPVYAPGQGRVDPPVGLLLDKRFGLVRGPEMLANGDFSGGASNWGVTTNDATHVVTFSNGTCRYQSDTTTPTLTVSQGALSIVAGRWYEVTVVVSAWVSGSIKTDTLNGAAPVGLMLAGGVGTFKAVGLAINTTTVFSFLRNSANVDITIDSISVRELPGNHAYQTTTTNRPTLSARYNLLTSSENMAATWSTFNGSFSAVGAYWKFTENTSASLHSFLQTPAMPKAASYRASFVGKPDGRDVVRFVLNAYSGNFCEVRFNLATGEVVGVFKGGDGVVESSSIEPVGDGAYRCTLVGKPSAAAAGAAFDVSLGMMDGTTASYTGDGVSGILVNYFDCRSANDGVGLPPYQRVINANTYDTMGFPLYLKFDGVDDFLQTAAVDFSGTDKVTIAAALRKLTDVSVGMLAELGPDVTTTTGTFGLYSRNSGIAEGIMWRSRGTSIASAAPPGLLAPSSLVAVGSSDLSTGRHELRVNGASAALSLTTQGGGTYGNYPLYIGRRGGTSLPFNGRIYGLIIRNAATPDATIATVERYLNSKARIY